MLLLSKPDKMNVTCEDGNAKDEIYLYSNCGSKICSDSDEHSECDNTDDQSMLNYIISFFCLNILFSLLAITVWMRMKMSMKKSNFLANLSLPKQLYSK